MKLPWDEGRKKCFRRRERLCGGSKLCVRVAGTAGPQLAKRGAVQGAGEGDGSAVRRAPETQRGAEALLSGKGRPQILLEPGSSLFRFVVRRQLLQL